MMPEKTERKKNEKQKQGEQEKRKHKCDFFLFFLEERGVLICNSENTLGI